MKIHIKIELRINDTPQFVQRTFDDPTDDEIENWLRSDGIRTTLQIARQLGVREV